MIRAKRSTDGDPRRDDASRSPGRVRGTRHRVRRGHGRFHGTPSGSARSRARTGRWSDGVCGQHLAPERPRCRRARARDRSDCAGAAREGAAAHRALPTRQHRDRTGGPQKLKSPARTAGRPSASLRAERQQMTHRREPPHLRRHVQPDDVDRRAVDRRPCTPARNADPRGSARDDAHRDQPPRRAPGSASTPRAPTRLRAAPATVAVRDAVLGGRAA